MIESTISHYHILAELVSGAMGVVYKAEDTRLRRHVALKFLPAEMSGDSVAKNRFVREARSASSLDHPNICTVYEIARRRTGICSSPWRIRGRNSVQHLTRAPQEIMEIVGIAEQASRGLAEAHAKGIVHRDIKPANLFITDNGLVKVLDFGVAKLVEQARLTRVESMVGTISYMSPEQVRGEDVDHRADIWSLGVVLYEALSGRLPFEGNQAHTMILSILESTPTNLRELEPSIPQELVNIVHQCLEKNARSRYRDTNELVADLEGFRLSRSVATPGSDASAVRSLVARSTTRALSGTRGIHPGGSRVLLWTRSRNRRRLAASAAAVAAGLDWPVGSG